MKRELLLASSVEGSLDWKAVNGQHVYVSFSLNQFAGLEDAVNTVTRVSRLQSCQQHNGSYSLKLFFGRRNHDNK